MVGRTQCPHFGSRKNQILPLPAFGNQDPGLVNGVVPPRLWISSRQRAWKDDSGESQQGQHILQTVLAKRRLSHFQLPECPHSCTLSKPAPPATHQSGRPWYPPAFILFLIKIIQVSLCRCNGNILTDKPPES